MVINRVIFSTLKRLMRIEGIDEDIRARLLKTLTRFPHLRKFGLQRVCWSGFWGIILGVILGIFRGIASM